MAKPEIIGLTADMAGKFVSRLVSGNGGTKSKRLTITAFLSPFFSFVLGYSSHKCSNVKAVHNMSCRLPSQLAYRQTSKFLFIYLFICYREDVHSVPADANKDTRQT